MSNYLVCGASSGIGLALVLEFCQLATSQKIIATHRPNSDLTALLELQKKFPNKLHLHVLQADHEPDYENLKNIILAWNQPLDVCVNSIGLLQDQDLQVFPERKIEEFSLAAFSMVVAANVAPTLLLAKHLKGILRESASPLFVSLSAKVGSIGDNKMGGWYSYRISKTALNMAIRNFALEMGRVNARSCVLALHPGTTESKLSEPFMDSAKKKYTIHQPSETARNLIKVIEQCVANGETGAFYSWDGTLLPW